MMKPSPGRQLIDRANEPTGQRAGGGLARELDLTESLERGQHVVGLASAVRRARLQDGIARLTPVAVGQYVVVREKESVAGGPVAHDTAEGARRDTRVPEADAARCRALTRHPRTLRLDVAHLKHIGRNAIDLVRDDGFRLQCSARQLPPHQRCQAKLVAPPALDRLQPDPQADDIGQCQEHCLVLDLDALDFVMLWHVPLPLRPDPSIGGIRIAAGSFRSGRTSALGTAQG